MQLPNSTIQYNVCGCHKEQREQREGGEMESKIYALWLPEYTYPKLLLRSPSTVHQNMEMNWYGELFLGKRHMYTSYT